MNIIDKNLFGERLKSLMKNYKETTYSLGKILNLSPPTISRYTRGEMIPKMTTIQAIAKYFNVSPNWLAGISQSILDNEILEETNQITSVPIFESIKYSLPIFSNKKIDQKLNIPIEMLSKWGAVIGFQVSDNAMSPYIRKGDLVIIQLGKTSVPGNYIALHVNEGNLIIRKIVQIKNSLILQPTNINYDAQIFNKNKDNVHIIGTVVFIHREENKLIEKFN